VLFRSIGKARNRIIETYPDLDVEIEPYESSPEVRERVRSKLREMNTQMSDGQDWTKPIKLSKAEWEALEDKITLKIDSIDKLTEHWIAEGERRAEERIIKYLESFVSIECDEYCAGGCECYGKWEAKRFIEYIQGGQK
jgi:hypothetical protein